MNEMDSGTYTNHIFIIGLCSNTLCIYECELRLFNETLTNVIFLRNKIIIM